MKEQIEKLKELEAKSTRVVSWYPHTQYDGSCLGYATVRGPFHRWFLVQHGQGDGEGVADMYDDAKYAAASMNALPSLITHIEKLEKDREVLVEALKSVCSHKGMTNLGSCCVNKTCIPYSDNGEKLAYCSFAYGVNRGFNTCAAEAQEALREVGEIENQGEGI